MTAAIHPLALPRLLETARAALRPGGWRAAALALAAFTFLNALVALALGPLASAVDAAASPSAAGRLSAAAGTALVTIVTWALGAAVISSLYVRAVDALVTGGVEAARRRDAVRPATRLLGTLLLAAAVAGGVAYVVAMAFASSLAIGILVLIPVAPAVVYAVATFSLVPVVALAEAAPVLGAFHRSAELSAGVRTQALALVVAPAAAASLVAPAAAAALVTLGVAVPFALVGAVGASFAAVVSLFAQIVVYRRLVARPAPVPSRALLEVRGLKKHFPIRGGLLQRTVDHVRAVDGVDLSIRRGATLGLVGESGCGKTTVGRAILRLTDPSAGEIRFDGVDVTQLPPNQMRELRRRMQIVFQDPMSSLNPRMTIKQILMEPLLLNGYEREEAVARVVELLETVGLSADHANRFPHEFSGGQRQRIGVARALALNPDFIVLDEPTSALDVSVQAQVLNLLQKLQRELDLTYLFISHDLGVIRHLCDEVAVMYLGRIVEVGPVEKVFSDPQHPYTQALLSAVPIPDPERRANRIILTGDVPSPINPPAACRFHPRCPRAQPVCGEADPPLEARSPGHLAACHFPGAADKWPAKGTPVEVRQA